jgi:hypothetical protein
VPLADERLRRLAAYLGPTHAACNLRAAAENRHGVKREAPLHWSRVWVEPIPENVVLNGNSGYEAVF